MSLQSRVSSIFSSESEEDTSDTGTTEDDDDGNEPSSGDPGVKCGEYSWEDYLREYSPGKYRGENEEGPPPYEDLPDKHQHDDLKPESIANRLFNADEIADELSTKIDQNTLNIAYEDEDDFFKTSTGHPTVVSRYDMEKEVNQGKKTHFVEIDRYWVNKPYSFVILFRSKKENEIKYFAIEPYLNLEEERLLQFLKNKLQDTIKFSEEATRGDRTNAERAAHIEEETYKLLFRYGLIDETPFEKAAVDEEAEKTFKQKLGLGRDKKQTASEEGDESSDDSNILRELFGRETRQESIVDKLIEEEEEENREEATPEHVYTLPEDVPELDGEEARPQDVVINEGMSELSDYQVMKLMYYLKRNSVSYGGIDPIKHDINIEDISCDGYNMRVWVYHGDHEQIISNIRHGKKELDDFVINLAQRSGQGISKRQPQVDITLPDGSRGQLTLGAEVSDHGTNYTIRQFKDVPFTPIDLICWKTFAPEQMAFLWLCIENHKSLIFAGGTASGKTTSLNAISLFIPSNTKIVSIEDTREVELPQRNWVASVTRPSFTEEGAGEVDEFALLEAALRQRPDYIVMGEIRGEEGRTLFQVMSTGHTTYTTFHADSVGEVIKRFTTDPINVSKTLFTALDLVSIQTATRVDGNKVRRNKVLTEVNDYNSETDEINVNDVFRWIADDDKFEQTEDSEVLDTIMFDRGWDEDQLDREIRKREVVIAYLIVERLNTYTEVAATVQAFINGPEIVLGLIANDMLEESLENLREMESVEIDIDPDKEEMVPRPEPPEDILDWAKGVLERESTGVLEGLGGVDPDGKLAELLDGAEPTNATAGQPDVDEEEAEELIDQLQETTTSDSSNSEDSDQSSVEGGLPDGSASDSKPLSSGEPEPELESDGEIISDDDDPGDDNFSGFVAAGEPETADPEIDVDPVDNDEDEEEDEDPGHTEDLTGFIIDDDEDTLDDDRGETNGN